MSSPKNTVTTLLLAFELRDIVANDGCRHLTPEETNRRVNYWAYEVLKRVSLFAADRRGWIGDRRGTCAL